MHDWLRAWPALARACGLPDGPDGRLLAPSPSQQCKRAATAGVPPDEMLFFDTPESRAPCRISTYSHPHDLTAKG